MRRRTLIGTIVAIFGIAAAIGVGYSAGSGDQHAPNEYAHGHRDRNVGGFGHRGRSNLSNRAQDHCALGEASHADEAHEDARPKNTN